MTKDHAQFSLPNRNLDFAKSSLLHLDFEQSGVS